MSCVVLIEHLKSGKSVVIDEHFDSDVLALNDDELTFSSPIRVKGSSYLAEDLIVIQLDIDGIYHLPCSVCNRPVTIPFALKNTYITKPLSECCGGKIHFMEDLRESILLEVPSFAECNGKQCPERAQLAKHLKPHTQETSKQEDLYYPFDDLEERMNKP